MSVLFTVIESADEPNSGSGSPALKVSAVGDHVFLSIGTVLDGGNDFPDAVSGVDSQGISGVAGIAVDPSDLLAALFAVGVIEHLST